MGSTARTQRLEDERQSLEAAYLDVLKLALRDCAEGRWGLFGQNDGTSPPSLQARLTPKSVLRLAEVEAELIAVRDQLGYFEPYPPMERLAQLRSQRGANASGEQKLAHLFLKELTTEE